MKVKPRENLIEPETKASNGGKLLKAEALSMKQRIFTEKLNSQTEEDTDSSVPESKKPSQTTGTVLAGEACPLQVYKAPDPHGTGIRKLS